MLYFLMFVVVFVIGIVIGQNFTELSLLFKGLFSKLIIEPIMKELISRQCSSSSSKKE